MHERGGVVKCPVELLYNFLVFWTIRGLEADSPRLLSWVGHQSMDHLEYHLELPVVFSLHVAEPLGEGFVRRKHPSTSVNTSPEEGESDLNVPRGLCNVRLERGVAVVCAAVRPAQGLELLRYVPRRRGSPILLGWGLG